LYLTFAGAIGRNDLSTAKSAGDVGQRVWLQLVTNLNQIRDPAAIPGWLATTTHRECCTIQRAARRWQPLGWLLDAGHIPGPRAGEAEHELLAAERRTALHEAFTRLPAGWQQLIAALAEDPPVPYAQVSAQLGIPVGSIVPIRNRCLDKLRRDPALAASDSAEGPSARGELSRRTTVP
jgi:DNA-directed RNA polymerase specialized sigma24 family protein